MAHLFRGWFLSDERKRTAGLEHALFDFRERFEALLSCRRFELRNGNKLPLQIPGTDLAALDQDVSSALDQLVELPMVVEEPDYEVVGEQQRSGTDDSAQDAVVFADDGVLHGVRQSQQDDQVEWIELDEFALPREPKADHQERVDDNRPKDFFRQRKSHDEHIFPSVVHNRLPPRVPPRFMTSAGRPRCQRTGRA